MQRNNEFAAVDLGSNSFHMVVAADDGQGLTIIDRERDMVRLGAGLGENGRLSPESKQRAFECLADFGRKLKGLTESHVMVVGTSALRRASDTKSFIPDAENILGFPIQIISGLEEARLIYAGVNYYHDDIPGPRLVVDIGGGSTELIAGENSTLLDLESVEMGCINYTQRCESKGRLSAAMMKTAISDAKTALAPHTGKLIASKFTHVIGSSGTARAIERVVTRSGWCEEGISRKSLNKLVVTIADADRIDDLALPGLSDERRPVFVGGVAIMAAIFDSLELEKMHISEGALREGALIELVDRRKSR